MTDANPDMSAIELALDRLTERARRARMRRSERDYPPLDAVQPVLAEWVAAYRSASESDRARMRERSRGAFDLQTWLLWSAAEWARKQTAAHVSSDELECALAALSLEDAELDAEESQLVLGIVWHRARRAELDLRSMIERVAALSTTHVGGFAPLLLAFEDSPFFTESVAPHLGASCLPFEVGE